MENLNETLPEQLPDEIDEAMLEMRDFVAQMADVEGYLYEPEMLASVQLKSVDLSMPMQLDLHVRKDGSLSLGGSPPLYYADTTIMPVFHQIKIKIELTEKSDSHAGSSK
jgi:hypothetical protein